MLRNIYILVILAFSINAIANEPQSNTKLESSERWVYTVRPGDTIFDIVNLYLVDDVYIEAIIQLNNIADPKKLNPGQRISVPKIWLLTAESAVEIDDIYGSVRVYREKQLIEVKVGDYLYAKDELVTDELSSISLKFADSSIMTIESKSRLQLVKIIKNVKNSGTENKVKLDEGRFEMHANPQKRSHYKFEIETPSAVSSIRGTFYRVGSDKNMTRVEVLNGRTVVKQKKFNNREYDVIKGKGVFLDENKPDREENMFELLEAPKLDKEIDNILSWKELSGAKTYRLQLSKNEDFNDIHKSWTSDSNKIDLNQLLIKYEKLYLRIRGIDEQGLEGYDLVHPIVCQQQKHRL